MERKRAQPSIDRRIAGLAERQHGVVSRGQLMAAGLEPGAIEHRLRAGRLHRVHRGVYAVGHRILASDGRWMAAALACGHGAVVSHRSAGALWELRPTASAAVDVTVPSRAGRRPRPGIAVHRSTALSASEVGRRRGIPVTSPARTLLDLAELLPGSALERAVERAEALRLLDLHGLRAVLAVHPTRPGSGLLAEILEQHHSEVAVTRSELENLFLELCSVHGLARPLVNTRVHAYEVDFLWPQQRVIVETDGREHHGTRTAFERDRARDARLVVIGYKVLRFTHRQVTREPEVVAGLLRSVLEGAPFR